MSKQILFVTLFFSMLLACGTKNETDDSGSTDGNYLSMKINGVEWKADHDVFGAFHPGGYNKAIIIAGAKGPKDATEQTMNINLYNTSGPGVFEIKNGNPDLNVAQLGNFTPQKFLYGSMMGFDMKVTVKKASGNPDVVEATFEGTMTSNEGDVINITEGKFYYHE